MLTDEQIRQCWYSNGPTMPNDGMYRQYTFARAIEAAVIEECAKAAEDATASTAFQSKECYRFASAIAAAIRAKKEKS